MRTTRSAAAFAHRLARAVEFLGFQTPTTMPAANQCGKVLFADPHIKDAEPGAGGDASGVSRPFPSGCKTNASTGTMKALEFLFFDLDACL